MTDLDIIWRGAVLAGVIGLNFKFVYDAIKGYRDRKNGRYNGTERRHFKNIDDCHIDMSKLNDCISDKITKVHNRIDETKEKVSRVGEDVSYIRGKIEGVIK